MSPFPTSLIKIHSPSHKTIPQKTDGLGIQRNAPPSHKLLKYANKFTSKLDTGPSKLTNEPAFLAVAFAAIPSSHILKPSLHWFPFISIADSIVVLVAQFRAENYHLLRQFRLSVMGPSTFTRKIGKTCTQPSSRQTPVTMNHSSTLELLLL